MTRQLFFRFACIVIAFFVFLLSACSPAPAPSATSAPTFAPTALAMSTLAPSATPTLTATPLPTLTPTITPTPAPDTTTALALARAQIKNFNDKDFSVTATWLADKRALVVIQSKIENDAWVLLPGAKEFLRVPTTAGIDGKIPLVRFEVEADSTMVAFTAYSDEMVRKPSGGVGPKGETKFYWQKWQGKDQWVTVKPINPDIKTADAAGLLEALKRMDASSRGAPFNMTGVNESGAFDKNVPVPFPSLAALLEGGLKYPDVAAVLKSYPVDGLVHGLAGVELRHLSAGWTDPKGRVDYSLDPTADGKFILVINDASLIPYERGPYGGGASVDREGKFAPGLQRFVAAILIIADQEIKMRMVGSDPRGDSRAETELQEFARIYWSNLVTRFELTGMRINGTDKAIANYLKVKPLRLGQVFVDTGELAPFFK